MRGGGEGGYPSTGSDLSLGSCSAKKVTSLHSRHARANSDDAVRRQVSEEANQNPMLVKAT